MPPHGNVNQEAAMKSLFLLATVQIVLAFASASAEAEKIYWTDMGHEKIRRANLDGSAIEELVTIGLQAPGVIAIDGRRGKMYWTDWVTGTSRIQRANLDGTEVEDLVIGLNGPWGIALDTQTDKMYWTEFAARVIRRANLDGSAVENLVTTGLNHPNGIALDLTAGKMYWCDSGYYAFIRRANLDGSNIETLVSTGLSVPMEIELDLQAQKMYWTDLGTDKIQRADLSGANVATLITGGFGTYVGLGLDPAAGKMYYSDSGDAGSQLRRANLDGTGIQVIVTSGIGACYGLTLDLEPFTAVTEVPTTTIRLAPASPNPFNPATVLSYTLGTDTRARLVIYDLRGEHIATLVDRYHPAGIYQAIWDARKDSGQPVSSGIYFCRLEAGHLSDVTRLVLLK